MPSLSPLTIDGHSLTLPQVVEVAREGRPVALGDAARARVAESLAWVEAILAGNAPIYGINTGFGIFADRRISVGDTAQLTRNLILSHAVGTGEPLPAEVVRAAMLIRANTLALGHSGVRPEVVETLLAMLNAHVTPLVPSQGSLGASGDLAPLAHLALVLSTDAREQVHESGHAIVGGERLSGSAAMNAARIPRLILGAKEGLALTNGATFSAALAVLALADADNAISHAELALALSLEALLGVSAAFDQRLHAARRHVGQQAVAEAVRRWTAGSTFVDASARVQDAYSLRCAPQVMGPARDTVEFGRRWVESEINAATDNPLLFAAEGRGQALSGGNFHGEVLGLATDFLGIAMAEVGALAERRIFRLTDARLNGGLPPMLVGAPGAAGLNSGLMMAHYVASSLVLENQTLAHPDSVHSLPTSAEQEDHNANSMTAARHARQIVRNVEHILAIELLAAAQAIDLRRLALPGAHLAPATAAAHAAIREIVPFLESDRLIGPEIERMSQAVRGRTLPVI